MQYLKLVKNCYSLKLSIKNENKSYEKVWMGFLSKK